MSTKFAKIRLFNFIFVIATLVFIATPNNMYGKKFKLKEHKTEQVSEQQVTEQDPELSELEGSQNVTISSDSTVTANLKAIIKPVRTRTEVELNSHFYISLGLDLLMLFLIIGLIYYPNYKKLDTVFTFVLFNVSIFLLTFLLNQVKISMGAAFGLFAVFSMLRYRTEGISVKDMTYMFIFIAMGLLSGIQLDIVDLMIVFAVIFVLILLLDTKILIKRESTKIVYFEDINFIHTDKEAELIEELKKRTGLNVHRISIDEISYLRDSATITIYYYE